MFLQCRDATIPILDNKTQAITIKEPEINVVYINSKLSLPLPLDEGALNVRLFYQIYARKPFVPIYITEKTGISRGGGGGGGGGKHYLRRIKLHDTIYK